MKRSRSGSVISQRAVTAVGPGTMAVLANKKAVRRLSKRISKLEKEDELKFLDTALSFTFDSTGEVPATGQLILIPQGDGESEREGRQIVLKACHLRGSVTHNPGASAGGNSSTCHLYLVQDRQANSAAAGATDVFTSTNFASAMRNMGNISRFKILLHWIHTFSPAAGATTAFSTTTTALEEYVKLKDMVINYDAAAAAIGSIASNNIFLLAGTDGNSDDIVTVAGTARVTFNG